MVAAATAEAVRRSEQFNLLQQKTTLTLGLASARHQFTWCQNCCDLPRTNSRQGHFLGRICPLQAAKQVKMLGCTNLQIQSLVPASEYFDPVPAAFWAGTVFARFCICMTIGTGSH